MLDPASPSSIHKARVRGAAGGIMGRLLIVDDEPDYLDELAEALAFAGVASASVPRGAAAIEAVRDDPDITTILTDIRMPDMDGIALIEMLKTSFPDRNLRFIVMTGHAAEVDIRRAEAAGAVRCFSKPLDFEALCAAIVSTEGSRERTQ